MACISYSLGFLNWAFFPIFFQSNWINKYALCIQLELQWAVFAAQVTFCILKTVALFYANLVHPPTPTQNQLYLQHSWQTLVQSVVVQGPGSPWRLPAMGTPPPFQADFQAEHFCNMSSLLSSAATCEYWWTDYYLNLCSNILHIWRVFSCSLVFRLSNLCSLSFLTFCCLDICFFSLLPSDLPPVASHLSWGVERVLQLSQCQCWEGQKNVTPAAF